MTRTSEEQCRLCTAPAPLRALAENLRRIGLTHREVATALKALRDFPIHHASVFRHEKGGHFDPQLKAELAPEIDEVDWENFSIKDMVGHKAKLYWQKFRDVVPNDSEMRAWMKLYSEIREDEREREKMAMLQKMFTPAPAALPAPAVEGEFEEVP